MNVNCDYCHKPATLVTGDVIYPHRPDLGNKRFWHCRPCKAWVGCHANSPAHAPLGRLANAELRVAKQAAHAAFDPLWKSGRMTRLEAYRKLAECLGLDTKQTHIGRFDVELCQRVIKAAADIAAA
ncbi:MAG: hypothetical protein KGL35_04280 [Bradyrhizobium sp.]|nr:hypothetical protein [Bradyrhizobium sp.]